MSINFLFYICAYLLGLAYVYATSAGREYGPGFAIPLFSLFALFIYLMQAIIISIGSLLIFPFVKRKLDTINTNIQINATNSTQTVQLDWISIVTKVLLLFFVAIGIVIYFFFYS